MGLLRLILAISVVIWHSSPIFGISLVGGQAAVQAFYIISGFYMALILNIMLFFDIQTNTGLILVILTLILSYLLNRFVSEKIEIYRQSRLNFN